MRVAGGRRRASGLAAAVGLLAVVVTLVVPTGPVGADPGPAPPSRQRVILNIGHTDALDVQYVDGQLRLQTRAGERPFQFYPASDVLFQLKDIDQVSRVPIPDIPQYAFLGPAGAPVWVAPEVENEELVWPGFDAEHVPSGVLARDEVTIGLVSVTGPGTVEVFDSDPLGRPGRMFSSRDSSVRSMVLGFVGSGSSHRHANWAFSALGRYELTFEATATDVSGRALSSGPVTYTWFVGGTQASDVVVQATSAALAVSPPSSSVGQQVTLTGSVTPTNAPGWVEFRDGDAVLGHAAVSGGQAVLTTTGIGAGARQLTARFVPANATDFQASTSPPVPYQVSGTGSSTSGSTTTTTATTSTTTTTATTAPGGTTSGSSSTPATTTTTCVTTTPQQQVVADAVVLNDGHVDYAARLVNGGLSAQVKDGTRPGVTTWREPSRVVFHVVPAAMTTLPATGFDFLGQPGGQVWLIPQTQKPGVLWLGWNTEEITAAQLRGAITWSLDRVQGPGALAVFTVTTFGAPQVLFTSADGLPDRREIPVGTHAHGNWAFTKEGIYRVTFTYSATLASGAQVRDTEVVTFAVGAVNPNSVLPSTTAVGNNGASCGGGGNAARRLATTGASLAGPLAAGGLLVLGGTLLVVIVRRRRAGAGG